ncbi:EF-hand domain-containing protein [Asticcacaulis sp. AC466]|uniref:EF-hand domain-containing protein n=1 Tax=Asticcacaulis sp. AC466 TaxID=1282362 RepID=UPI0004CF974B|nr:EF-hand domain-containing protein [Asticcacaulis sp. AC466]
MESLLSGQSQASQTSQSSLMSDTSQTSLTSHAHKHGGHHKPPSLQDMDSDGDGSLSKTEMEGYSQSTTGDSTTSKADALFSKMDTNGDGSVSAAEKSAFDQQMAANRPDGPPPGDAQGQPSTDGTSQTLSSIGTGAGSTDLASLMHELLSALQSYSASQGTTTSAASSTLSIAA